MTNNQTVFLGLCLLAGAGLLGITVSELNPRPDDLGVTLSGLTFFVSALYAFVTAAKMRDEKESNSNNKADRGEDASE